MKELLQEILDSGQDATLPLDMETWFCGSAACLCGDVAIKRTMSRNVNAVYVEAVDFSIELDLASLELFGSRHVAEAIYAAGSEYRKVCAEASGVFTQTELNHPHLTTDHNSREIAHDFVRLVMEKI